MLTHDDVCLGAGASGSTAPAGASYTGDLSFGEVDPAPSLMTVAHVKEQMSNEETAKDSVASTLCSTLSEAKDSDSKSIHAALPVAGTQFTRFTST
jgi:hypothetical protein